MEEAEYNKKANDITEKLRLNQELTNEEISFFCEGTKFEYLGQFSFCEDYYFKRIFMAKRPEAPNEIKNSLKSEDIKFYQKSISDWGNIITKTNHSDQLLQITGQETRKELKDLYNNYSFIRSGFSLYFEYKFQILEWSKYRHITAGNVFKH